MEKGKKMSNKKLEGIKMKGKYGKVKLYHKTVHKSPQKRGKRINNRSKKKKKKGESFYHGKSKINYTQENTEKYAE